MPACSIACYITNVEGYGEQITVLKTIKSKDSPFADCLYEWKKCLEERSQTIKDKDFDKFWVNTYQRFDLSTKKEQKQAFRKCNPEASMKKDIWNFEHRVLDGSKEFLKLFINGYNGTSQKQASLHFSIIDSKPDGSC